MLLRLGIRLQAISLDRTVRILHHLLLNIFRTPTLFTHAFVPSAFRLQVSVMIQECSSKFFPTVLGIRKPRHATHTTPLTGERAQAILRGRPRGRLGVFGSGKGCLRGRPRGRLGPRESETTFFRDRLDRLGSTQGAGAIL